MAHTPGPWFLSGIRATMNGGQWHCINRWNPDTKQDENIACVGYDPETHAGYDDARLLAASLDLAASLRATVRQLDAITRIYVSDPEAKAAAEALIADARAVLRAAGVDTDGGA